MNFKSLRVAVLLAVVLVPVGSRGQNAPPPASAGQDHTEGAKLREACRGDVQRFCGNIRRGQGRVRECLREHAAEPSDGCEAAIKEAREHQETPQH